MNVKVRLHQNIAILGSTGSIGTQTLEVIASYPDRFTAAYLTVNNNIPLLLRQVERFRPKGVVVLDPAAAETVRSRCGPEVEVLTGPEGLSDVVRRTEVDTVVSALVGFAGLRPTVDAITAGKRIALANKETLVVAGSVMMPLAERHNVRLLPVDSEHSAIFQCLTGEPAGSVTRIILTASGGPFRSLSANELRTVTVGQALKHPNWSMGSKITIDSATLMNKGLEVIEAHWLFGMPAERIDVVVHPQSIIHSMVEFADGSVKAQLGVPDMTIPIQYALTYPDRFPTPTRRVDFPSLREMTFFSPDTERFPCLRLAYDALRAGGTMPAVLNAANEVAVARFLAGAVPFTQIPVLIETAMDRHVLRENPTLEDIVEADGWTRDILSTF